jgi:pimeloyl-ACP methyl ester carboxylesterase
MATALEGFLEGAGYIHPRLVFVGYSGGATLAMLLAPRFTQTRAIVTIAGNLDPDAWTQHHGYTPLTESLNPTRQKPPPDTISQLHFAGAEDRNIPPALTREALRRHPRARFEVLPGVAHRRGWYQAWPELLAQFPPDPH